MTILSTVPLPGMQIFKKISIQILLEFDVRLGTFDVGNNVSNWHQEYRPRTNAYPTSVPECGEHKKKTTATTGLKIIPIDIRKFISYSRKNV